MTGPGEGKLPLSAQVYLNAEELPNASVYIHLKGYSRATVTHLDIEHPELNSIIPPKTKPFTWIVGIENGILIITENDDKVKIIHPLLTKVLQSPNTSCGWLIHLRRTIWCVVVCKTHPRMS